MRAFIESLKRLYRNQMIDAKKIYDLYDSGTITADEKDYILSSKSEQPNDI